MPEPTNLFLAKAIRDLEKLRIERHCAAVQPLLNRISNFHIGLSQPF